MWRVLRMKEQISSVVLVLVYGHQSHFLKDPSAHKLHGSAYSNTQCRIQMQTIYVTTLLAGRREILIETWKANACKNERPRKKANAKMKLYQVELLHAPADWDQTWPLHHCASHDQWSEHWFWEAISPLGLTSDSKWSESQTTANGHLRGGLGNIIQQNFKHSNIRNGNSNTMIMERIILKQEHAHNTMLNVSIDSS